MKIRKVRVHSDIRTSEGPGPSQVSGSFARFGLFSIDLVSSHQELNNDQPKEYVDAPQKPLALYRSQLYDPEISQDSEVEKNSHATVACECSTHNGGGFLDLSSVEQSRMVVEGPTSRLPQLFCFSQ